METIKEKYSSFTCPDGYPIGAECKKYQNSKNCDQDASSFGGNVENTWNNFSSCEGGKLKNLCIADPGNSNNSISVNYADVDDSCGTKELGGTCKIPTDKVNVEGEFSPSKIKIGTSGKATNEIIDDYCNGGEAERRERAADFGVALSSGLMNLVGMGSMTRKLINIGRGGSPNYVDQPTEIIKSMSDRLRQTRDRAFYISQCGEYVTSTHLFTTIKQLETLINLEIKQARQELEFEVKGLGIADMSLSICIIVIVTYLLIIVVEPKK